jgi:hypothetical protein
MVLNMDMTATGGTQPGTISMDTTSDGGINLDTNQMELTMDLSMTSDNPDLDTGLQNMSYSMYMLTDWVYMKIAMPGLGEQWMKANITNPDESFNMNIAEQQTAMLESPSKIELVRSETVDGVDCNVFSITPNMDELADWYNEQGSTDLNNNIDYTDVFKEYSILCYVSKDANQLKRMALTMVMQMNAEDAGESSEEFDMMNIDVLMDMTIADQNGSFSVVLPPEAENAIEVSEDMFSEFR